MEHRHFHRRSLPHLYYNDGIYFITFRLADSLPQKVLEAMRAELLNSSIELSVKQKKIFEKYDTLLRKNEKGKCYLSDIQIAREVESVIKYWEGKEYEIVAYCIMPNHVHLIFKLLPNNRGISKIMQSIKRTSAVRCNKKLNLTNAFWQHESYDRLVRNDEELYYEIRYVINNPVNAGLVDDWKKYPFTYCNPFYY